MGNEIIKPIDEETAKAVQELSRFGSKITDAGIGAGGYLSTTMGSLPANLVGLIGDQVEYWRRRRWINLKADLDRRLAARGVAAIEASPTLAIPIFEAALDETREELQELWQRLLANAHDPNRTHSVRVSFIALLKRFDPMDALVFEAMASEPTGTPKPNARDYVIARLNIPMNEVLLSFETLIELGCFSITNRSVWDPVVTPKGELLYQALKK